MGMRFKFDFSLNQVEYLVKVHPSWEISLCAKSRDPWRLGIDDSDNWCMPDFYFAFHTHGHCTTPVAVFRQLVQGLAPWVRKVKPAYLCFQCDEPKKFRLYERLLLRSGLHTLYDIQLGEQHAYLHLRQP